MRFQISIHILVLAMAAEVDARDSPPQEYGATHWTPHPHSYVGLQESPANLCPTDFNNNRCKLTVEKCCAQYYTNLVEGQKANFAKFEIRFDGNVTVNQTADAILPNRWVWSYYQPHGFFPYLKWPIDFKILSVHMLSYKTLPVYADRIILYINVSEHCSLTLGGLNTTCQLGEAFKDLTQNYMIKQKSKAQNYGYSYWCYTKEVPGIRHTWAYSLAKHLGSPLEFARYNCCRTNSNLYNSSQLEVRCIDQVSSMFQIRLIPYITALLAFAYFPILLFTMFGQSMTRRHRTEDDAVLGKEQYWVYLDGKAPISFSCLVGGLCGLTDRHPHVVSRFHRTLFLLTVPLLVYLQIYVYWKYMYREVLAYLDHGKPMQFLSLIGGAKQSMNNFAPAFGGPLCLFVGFYIAGIILILFPTNINNIVHKGCARDSDLGDFSPLFYNEDMLVKLSGIPVQECFGYTKVAAIFRAEIYMLVNGRFWFSAIKLQIRRIRGIYSLFTKALRRQTKVLCFFIIATILPIYISICMVELSLCILVYGIPVISCIYTMAKGYKSAICALLVKDSITEVGRPSQLIGACVIKGLVYVLAACLFVYFTFSISAIVTASFNFLGQVIIMCFIAVIVYPLYAFGYVFFTVIILYYIFKQLENFGEGYFELLAMAVEICTVLEEDIYHARIENDTIVINKTHGAKISKLRVHDQIINLSTDLRNRIQNTPSPQRSRVAYKNNTVGIPRDLFDHLVSVFRPIHVQVFHAVLRLGFIAALVAGAVSLVVVKPFGPNEDLAEVLHLIFIMVIGALPKIIEIALDKSNHIVKEDIRRAQMKAEITEYLAHRDTAVIY